MTVWFTCPKCSEETPVTVVRSEAQEGKCLSCGRPFDENDEASILDRADQIAREPLDDDV